MLRADMDALPIKEATGLPYASSVTAKGPDGKTTPVAHSCGHDMHVACLMGATSLFAKTPPWAGMARSWQSFNPVRRQHRVHRP